MCSLLSELSQLHIFCTEQIYVFMLPVIILYIYIQVLVYILVFLLPETMRRALLLCRVSPVYRWRVIHL